MLRDILPLLIYPLSVALLGLLGVALMLLAQRRYRTGLVTLLAVLLLWLSATPAVSSWLRQSLERAHPVVPLDAVPTAAAIAVLGGAITPARPPDRPYPGLHGDSDRLWHAARLYHAGKAPRIVAIGGGRTPDGQPLPEAVAMVGFLTELGVPERAILLEGDSLSTCQNARYSAPLLAEHGIERILLVTSAFHMPRALRSFRAAGIDAHPVSANAAPRPERLGLFDLVPDAGALAASQRMIREYLALLVYRLRDWRC